MQNNNWQTTKVIHGSKIGKKLGFPTLNLEIEHLSLPDKGVYAARVKIDGKIYDGVLFYGPRVILQETKEVLEIHLFDFDKEIYGETVSFCFLAFIRRVKNFPDFEALKKQLAADCQKAKAIISRPSAFKS